MEAAEHKFETPSSLGHPIFFPLLSHVRRIHCGTEEAGDILRKTARDTGYKTLMYRVLGDLKAIASLPRHGRTRRRQQGESAPCRSREYSLAPPLPSLSVLSCLRVYSSKVTSEPTRHQGSTHYEARFLAVSRVSARIMTPILQPEYDPSPQKEERSPSLHGRISRHGRRTGQGGGVGQMMLMINLPTIHTPTRPGMRKA